MIAPFFVIFSAKVFTYYLQRVRVIQQNVIEMRPQRHFTSTTPPTHPNSDYLNLNSINLNPSRTLAILPIQTLVPIIHTKPISHPISGRLKR
jgi:hypothetical protein